MLLVLDVGNTNTVLGVFEPKPAERGVVHYGRLIAQLARFYYEDADGGRVRRSLP